MVNASIVTVICLVWICEKHLLPELYLAERDKKNGDTQISVRFTFPRRASADTATIAGIFAPPSPETGGNLLKELIEHKFIDLTWPGAIQLEHRFVFRPIAVQRTELAASVAEQYEEMFGFAAVDFVEHFLLGVAVHHAREHAIFDGVQDDAAIRLCRRLLVQSRSYAANMRQNEQKEGAGERKRERESKSTAKGRLIKLLHAKRVDV